MEKTRVKNAPISPLEASLRALENRCPNRVEDIRWDTAIEDGRRFLAQWGEQAAQLGWTPEDLFGLHPTAPLARYDHMGLAWLLDGRRVVALTEHNASILCPAGHTLTFHRKGSAPNAQPDLPPPLPAPFQDKGKAPAGSACIGCQGIEPPIRKISNGRPGARTETLHPRCAEAYFAAVHIRDVDDAEIGPRD